MKSRTTNETDDIKMNDLLIYQFHENYDRP